MMTVEVPMRIGMLTASMSHSGGGVFNAVRLLARALHLPPRLDVTVFGLDDGNGNSDGDGAWGAVTASAHPISLGPRAWGYSRGLAPALHGAGLDLLHMHGLWMYPSVAGLRWARRRNRPTVISPHGMLDPWALARGRGKKLVTGWLYEWANLRRAACIHALCHTEARAIRALGLANPICVIPNAVTLPAPERGAPPPWAAALPSDARVLLYLGRLHPKKNLPPLIRAWRARTARPGPVRPWHLVIAGWSQGGHEAELRQAAGADPTIHFVGPQFGAGKTATFARADGFILPSLSEGLPVAVLEAWSFALPVLMTDFCNLPAGFEAGAALPIGTTQAEIGAGLDALFAQPDAARHAMGEAGRRLVQDRFAWPRVAAEMASVYRWLLAGGPRPGSLLTEP